MGEMPNFCLLRAVKSGPGHPALALGGGDSLLKLPAKAKHLPATASQGGHFAAMEDRKFPLVRSIPGCAKTPRAGGRQSLVWPKMPKLVRARQRRSVSITTLAQKYCPLVQYAEIKLAVEKELARDFASFFWEGMGEEPEEQHANIRI